MDTSPMTVLEAILDEVDGLRRTDPRSFLPRWLMQQARDAVAPAVLYGTAQPPTGGLQMTDVDSMQGQTIAHVFEGLKHGDLALLFTNGTFIVLEAEGHEDAELAVCRSWSNEARTITHYVYPRDLAAAGVLSTEECKLIEQREQELKVKAAQSNVDRARRTLEAAQAELEKLTPPIPRGVPA